MNSKYKGSEVEELLDKISRGGMDSCQLGEIRFSPKIGNPFGDKYVMCAGQPVSTDEYPDAFKALPVKGLDAAKKVSYPVLTEAPYMEMSNTPFQITDDLIGKSRIVAIPPATENPTDEDYMAMYASMKMYVDISKDGENWIQVYEFPKKEGEVFGAFNPLLANGKLIFPLQIVRFDLINGTQTTEVGRLLITSDFENFQEWYELEMNVPGALTTQWEIDSMAYGQGTYVAILKETHEGQNRMALLKSPDLVNWEYASPESTSWEQTINPSEWYNMSAHYIAGRWLVQFGYFLVGDNIETLFSNENVSTGDGTENDLQDDIEDIYYQSILGEEVYILRVSHGIFQLTFDTTTNHWSTYKHSSPTGFGTSERYIALTQMGEGTLSWLVFGNSNHYYVFPNGENAETLSLTDGASGWQLNEVLKLGTKLFLVPNASGNSPYLSSAFAATPGISQPGMMVAYIKLKE